MNMEILCVFWLQILLLIQIESIAKSTPIVGGQMVAKALHSNEKKYPYIVSLQDHFDLDRDSNKENASDNHNKSSTNYRHFCGGSLISSHWILTAAHCIWRKKIDKIVAVIGYENIENIAEEDRHAIELVEYIFFQPNNYQNDIALLRLKHAYLYRSSQMPTNLFDLNKDVNITAIYAKLPTQGMRANRKKFCTIVGYGAIQHGGDIQKNLIEGQVNVITKKQCRKILGYIWAPQQGENTVCALGKNQDTCQGDSGGPLICNYDGQDYIFGIISHGLACGISGIPSIYTVVIPYQPWIELVVHD